MNAYKAVFDVEGTLVVVGPDESRFRTWFHDKVDKMGINRTVPVFLTLDEALEFLRKEAP